MNAKIYEQLEKPLSGDGANARPPAPLDEGRITTAVNAPPSPTPARPAAAVIGSTPRLILFAAGAFLAYRFFDAISQTMLLFFMAFVVAIVLNAPVRLLEKRGVRRSVSAAGVALIVLGGMTAAGYLAGPPLAEQATRLAQNAPQGMKRIRGRIDKFTDQYPALRTVVRGESFSDKNAAKEAQRALPKVGRFTLGVLGGFASLLFLLVTALYTLGAPHALVRGAIAAVPPGYRRPATRAMTRIVGQIESWALATLLLMVIVGTLCGLGLWAIGVPNALLFGVIAGLGEGIPTIGPILSAVPPLIVAFADEPRKAMWVAGLFLVVQQVENNILVPIIMGRSLKLHPVSILFFVLALGAVLGILGALLAVPATIITKVLYEEFYLRPRRPHAAALDRATTQVIQAGSRSGVKKAQRAG
jgi:predicted PurR-regulated permease PerM